MKKIVILFSMLTLIAGVFVSCKKETGKHIQFTATTEDCSDIKDTKMSFNGQKMVWEAGDRVYIYSTRENGDPYGTDYERRQTRGEYVVELQGENEPVLLTYVSGDEPLEGADTNEAVYPMSIWENTGNNESWQLILPQVQVSQDGSLHGAPMYARSETTNFNFKHLCGVLKLKLQKPDKTINSIAVTTSKYNSGLATIMTSIFDTWEEWSPIDITMDHGTHTVTLQCNQSIKEMHDFYIYLPAGTHSDLELDITASDGTVCHLGPASSDVVIERGKYSTLTLTADDLDFVPTGVETIGLFTINASGDQVTFSMGNLQYQPSSHTYRFAPEQYNVCGNSNRVLSIFSSSWIDLFGWGTGNNPTQTGDAHTFCTFVDWGNNPISNGTYTGWRTLSQPEWEYLINYRPNASSKYGLANVGDIDGLILLPDNWTTPSSIQIPALSTTSTVTYTAAQWTAMENNGAIFLPKAGYRDFNNNTNGVYDVGESGSYWSSSEGVNDYRYDELLPLAYSLDLHSNVSIDCANSRETGLSVRLVRDAGTSHVQRTIGRFTVNASNLQVEFSQGNLQYQPSTQAWRFAPQQYCIIGPDNSRISSSYIGWIDLFGWGTGNNPTQTGYSNNYSNYNTFVDWGVNTISNNNSTGWRTLTQSEWEYLINSRTNASSKRGYATVNKRNGMILLPDNWTAPSGVPAFSPSGSNTYNSVQWVAMENNGAIFLPFAGHRESAPNTNDVYSAGEDGYYWSSTEGENNGIDETLPLAYSLSLYSNGVIRIYDDNDRATGLSVRLVRNL